MASTGTAANPSAGRASGRGRGEPTQQQGRWSWRRWARSIITLPASPRAIALGVAIGLFVAFTPTMGFQIVLALLLASAVGASRAAAIIPVWITNPVTLGPVYAFTYWVGKPFWPSSPHAAISDRVGALRGGTAMGFWDSHLAPEPLLSLGADLFMPMLIGGVLVGFFFAAISYLPVKGTAAQFQKKGSDLVFSF